MVLNRVVLTKERCESTIHSMPGEDTSKVIVERKRPWLNPPWPKGFCPNPGGQPKGKRISQWMAEYGEMEYESLPKINSKEWKKLPKNARIALRRLRAADAEEELGLANSKYVEPREIGAPSIETNGADFIQQIANAIIALKSAGIIFERVQPVLEKEQKEIIEVKNPD